MTNINKYIQTLKTAFLVLAVLAAFIVPFTGFGTTAFVSAEATCADGSAAPDGDGSKCTCKVGNEPSCPTNNPTVSGNNGGRSATTDPAVNTNADCTSDCNGLITSYIDPTINLLSVMVGVAVVISIVFGGIQYASSAGDSSKVSAAKNRIRNALVALIAFMFLYAGLQFIVPGGVFNR
jgi:hypothetical protein